MPDDRRKPRTFRVNVRYERRKFRYGDNDEKKSLHVLPGDTIKWTFKDPAVPFSVVIKSLVSLFAWSSKTAAGGEIVGVVRDAAAPGLYPYAFSAVCGGELLVDDPDIILPPPKA